jgi:hypothetical protein
LCPSALKKSARRADKLANCLGDDHDLAILRERIEHSEVNGQGGASPPPKGLIKKIAAQRARLQRKSYRLAQRLYDDKPKRVRKRFKKYFRAWQNR